MLLELETNVTLVSKLGKSILLREFQTYTTREEVRSIIGMHGFFNFFSFVFFFSFIGRSCHCQET